MKKDTIFKLALIVVFSGLTIFYSGCMPLGCEPPGRPLKAKATVAGYIYQHSRPMPNWKVQLIDESDRIIATEPTNAQGHFIISDVPPGDYTVRVLTFAGVPYPDYESPITVREGRTEMFDIELGS